jgi:hypothetical protein
VGSWNQHLVTARMRVWDSEKKKKKEEEEEERVGLRETSWGVHGLRRHLSLLLSFLDFYASVRILMVICLPDPHSQALLPVSLNILLSGQPLSSHRAEYRSYLVLLAPIDFCVCWGRQPNS